MRILEVETFGRGGLAHYVDNLARALANRGHEVILMTTVDYELEGRTSPPDNLRIEKIIASLSGKSPASSMLWRSRLTRKAAAIRSAVTVARRARRLQPDLIHLHCTNSVALLYLALLRRSRSPLAYTAHVITPHEPIPFQDAVYGRIHRIGDLVVVHSKVDRSRLLEEFSLQPSRVAVIPHGEYGFFERCGAPLDRETARGEIGLQPGDEAALFFGYIRDYKGLDVLLDAWPMVAAARPRARLVVAGDPVQLAPARRRELEASAERVGALSRFEYIPFDQVARYFAAADLLVLPYRRISQSGVLFLALSMGLPVVATNVGALPEVLQDGDSALLVPPDSPRELAAAVTRVLADADLRARLARGGRRVAASHSWESIGEQTEAAFEDLVRNYLPKS
jgi:glycosyltransferase involved in cell wall biosynthesis